MSLMGPPAVVPMPRSRAPTVMTLENVIDDKHWRSLFFQYLCSEHSQESLEFIERSKMTEFSVSMLKINQI